MDMASKPNTPSSDAIEQALGRVLASKTFEGNQRLASFLSYVVRESLAGQGKAIRAKTIALDVYGYAPGDIERRESVVRVDAGRLRRKLATYYRDEGQGEMIRMSLPIGSYAPQFETVNPGTLDRRPSGRPRRGEFSIGIAVSGTLVLVLLFAVAIFSPDPKSEVDERTLRRAVFETSPRRLEAINLANEARDLIFPAVNPVRLDLALAAFKTVVEIDPLYSGGHAGLSQVLATHAVLMPAGPEKDIRFAEAMASSRQALDLAPDEAWSLSAAAWLDFAQRDFEAGARKSTRASELAPNDPHIAEFDALIALYSGNFDRVIETNEKMSTPGRSDTGFVFRNAAGSAWFHKGEYEKSAKALEAAIADGAPVGPVSVAYLMAAYHRSGDQGRANELAARYRTNWPTQRVDLLFQTLFRDPAHGRDLSEGMRGAGWSPHEP